MKSETLEKLVKVQIEKNNFFLLNKILSYCSVNEISLSEETIFELVQLQNQSLYSSLLPFSQFEKVKTFLSSEESTIELITIEKIIDLNYFRFSVSSDYFIHKSDPRKIFPFHLEFFSVNNETANSLLRSLISIDRKEPVDAFNIYRMVRQLLKNFSRLDEKLLNDLLIFCKESMDLNFSFIQKDFAKILNYFAKNYPNKLSFNLGFLKSPLIYPAFTLFNEKLFGSLKEFFVSSIPSFKVIAFQCLLTFTNPNISIQKFKFFVDFSPTLFKHGNRSDYMIKLISFLIKHPLLEEHKNIFFPYVISFLCAPIESQFLGRGLKVLNDCYPFLSDTFPALQHYFSNLNSSLDEVVEAYDFYTRFLISKGNLFESKLVGDTLSLLRRKSKFK